MFQTDREGWCLGPALLDFVNLHGVNFPLEWWTSLWHLQPPQLQALGSQKQAMEQYYLSTRKKNCCSHIWACTKELPNAELQWSCKPFLHLSHLMVYEACQMFCTDVALHCPAHLSVELRSWIAYPHSQVTVTGLWKLEMVSSLLILWLKIYLGQPKFYVTFQKLSRFVYFEGYFSSVVVVVF